MQAVYHCITVLYSTYLPPGEQDRTRPVHLDSQILNVCSGDMTALRAPPIPGRTMARSLSDGSSMWFLPIGGDGYVLYKE